MKKYRKKTLLVLLCFIVCIVAGCATSESQIKVFSLSEIQQLLKDEFFHKGESLSNVNIHKYPENSFLFDNHCFCFYRDMDYYLGKSVRMDYLDTIISEYPPQLVRTIENNGTKSMYFIYETNANTRVFVFFFEDDDYSYIRGYPIIMKKTLTSSDFNSLKLGDSIEKVENIDPITSLFKDGYDKLNDDLINKWYILGNEKISSIHLLTDGILRIDYERFGTGNYTIVNMSFSSESIVNLIGGPVCYTIYPEDFI